MHIPTTPLARRVIKYRVENRLTQKELEDALEWPGCPGNYVYKIERGRIKRIRQEFLVAFSRVSRIPLEELLSLANASPDPVSVIDDKQFTLNLPPELRDFNVWPIIESASRIKEISTLTFSEFETLVTMWRMRPNPDRPLAPDTIKDFLDK